MTRSTTTIDAFDANGTAKSALQPVTSPSPRSVLPVDTAMGARIRAGRLKAGISQVELGAALGVSFQQIQKYEKGINRVTAARAAQIARSLRMSLDDLYGGDAVEQANPHALAMMGTREGSDLAEAFNRIACADHRRALLSIARVLAGIDIIPAGTTRIAMMQAAE